MPVKCHEEGIDNDAQRDEELDERIVHKEADELLELDPIRVAVPYAANVQPLEREGNQTLLDLGPFLVIVQRICGKKKKDDQVNLLLK